MATWGFRRIIRQADSFSKAGTSTQDCFWEMCEKAVAHSLGAGIVARQRQYTERVRVSGVQSGRERIVVARRTTRRVWRWDAIVGEVVDEMEEDRWGWGFDGCLVGV